MLSLILMSLNNSIFNFWCSKYLWCRLFTAVRPVTGSEKVDNKCDHECR